MVSGDLWSSRPVVLRHSSRFPIVSSVGAVWWYDGGYTPLWWGTRRDQLGEVCLVVWLFGVSFIHLFHVNFMSISYLFC